MKMMKDCHLQLFLSSDDREKLKKVLRVKEDKDYFNALLSYLDRVIYNYDEKYIDFIYKLLDLVECEVLNEVNCLEKFSSILKYRMYSDKLNHILYKKTRNISDPYNELKDIMNLISLINENFEKEIVNTSVKDVSFEEILVFLQELLEKDNVIDLDIINKLLHGLDLISNSDFDGIIEKTQGLEKLKQVIEMKIDEKSNFYKKEKNNLNNLNFVYKKLEKIENKISNNIRDDSTIDNDYVSLINYLLVLVDNLSQKNVSSIYKTLGVLEEEVNNTDDLVGFYKSIFNLIERFKDIEGRDRNHSNDYYFYDIFDRLKVLESSIISSIDESDIVGINNTIDYLFFEVRDYDSVCKFVKDNSFLISIYNNKNNILCEVLKRLLNEVRGKNLSYANLCYYNKVFDLLRNDKNFGVNDDNREELLEFKDDFIGLGDTDFLSFWNNDIDSRVNGEKSLKNENSINEMYGIVIPKYKKVNCRTKKGNIDDFIVTIDEDMAFNRDDAISVSKIGNDLYNLRVYISDPLAIFNMNSYPIKCARNNCETIYLRDNKIEMFHPKVIKKCLSLDEKKIRNVKVYSFVIDASGELVDFDILREGIRVSKNYSYDRFNRLLNVCSSRKEEKLIDNLSVVQKMFSNDISNSMSRHMTAEQLVTAIMIYTNSKVARYFAQEGYPFIYRHYESNSQNELERKFNNIYSRYLEENKKSVSNAVYSVECKNHDALGLGYYSHLTSPNRRYADIIANHCIDKFYFGDGLEEIHNFEKYLEREVNYLNDRLVGIDNYYEDYAKNVLIRK